MDETKESNFDKPVLYKKGQVIFCEGEPSSYLYIVKSGKVIVVKDDGQRVIPISLIEEKEFLGETSVFTDETRSASALALEHTELYVIKKSEIKHVLKHCPEWVGNIMATLCERLSDSIEILREHRIMDESLENMSTLNPQDLVKYRQEIDEYRSRRGIK